MSEKVFGRFQASVVFNDVAIYFSEEEWNILKQRQRDLYKNVVKEIHQAVISLGYSIINPDVLVRISKEEEPCLWKDHDSERRRNNSPFNSCAAVKPDVLIRIKESETSHSSDQQKSEKRESINLDTVESDSIDAGAKTTFELRHDEKTYNRNNHDSETTGSLDSPRIVDDWPVPSSVLPLNIKIEKESHPIAHEDSRRRASTSSPSTSYPVFNPELSLWIKEEDNPYSSDNPDSEERESVNSLNTAEISMNFFHYSDKQRICAGQDGPKWKERSPSKGRLDKPSWCGKGIRNLKRSLLVQKPHSGERLFQCSKCEKRFTRNSNLVAHQRTHTGERPHKCTECEWSFSHRSNLFRHQQIHRREQKKCLTVSQILRYTNEMNYTYVP